MDWGLVVRQCVWPCLVGYMFTSWCLVSPPVSNPAASPLCHFESDHLTRYTSILVFCSSWSETTRAVMLARRGRSESEGTRTLARTGANEHVTASTSLLSTFARASSLKHRITYDPNDRARLDPGSPSRNEEGGDAERREQLQPPFWGVSNRR